MRKVIVISMISLDGVLQAPGGPEEDTSGGFKYGGWTAPYRDKHTGAVLREQLKDPFDLLLGRRTYEIFKGHWPKNDDEIGKPINRATKYVVATTPIDTDWEKTVVLSGDAVDRIKELKQSDGPDLQVYGSGNLIQTLLKNDLVDELWLRIFPITLGTGNRLFAGGSIPAAFTLNECSQSPSGVIVANYKRSGDVQTGSL